MRVTEEQFEILMIKWDKRKEQVMNGKRTFRMDRWDCEKYFNVINETFHKPVCTISDRNPFKKMVYVTAVFHGTGSSTTKRGWMPESKVEATYPMWHEIYFTIGNLFKKNQVYI